MATNTVVKKNFDITCPYCFAKFTSDKVHFRMQTAHKMGTSAPLPDGYDDWDEVVTRYPNNDEKKRLLAMRDVYQFFTQRRDEKYEKFWETFGGITSETRPQDAMDDIEPYLRPVVDPANAEFQKYLQVQGQGQGGSREFLHYDADGMADSVTDMFGKVSNMRVCPHCHNPLPIHYGKNPVKFISVIGISGSGKTVYLSQLVRNIVTNTAKVGLTAYITSNSTRQFLRENPVQMNMPLPGSTQPEYFVQPLFYDLLSTDENGKAERNTVVLFDIAGENCTDEAKMANFGPFVRNAHGIVLLLDPKQLPFVNDDGYGDVEHVTAVLDTLYLTITGSKSEKSTTPLAVCIPKADKPSIQQIFSYNPSEDVVWYQPPTPPKKLFRKQVIPPMESRPDLNTQQLLFEDVKNLVNPQTHLPVPIFYSNDYNAISRKLERMIGRYIPDLGMKLNSSYQDFNFFAFSALGCDVMERVDENGLTLSVPISATSPKRIEEPLYWLFCKFGYIKPSEPLHQPFAGN